jgi:hypothetical protein
MRDVSVCTPSYARLKRGLALAVLGFVLFLARVHAVAIRLQILIQGTSAIANRALM